MEEKKTSETLKKEYDALVKKTKVIDSALKTAEADLEAFQVSYIPRSSSMPLVLAESKKFLFFYVEELKRVLQQDLNYLQIWARENRLSIHPIKTEAVLFGTHQRIAVNNELNLVLGNACVKRVQHYKYLGITLDANLNFHEHVDRLHCKLSSRLGALRRTRKHLTVDAANKVYTATILPLLDYCDIAWSSIGKTACARLDKLQERASKLILPQSREPLKHLKWLPLAKRRDMHTTTMTLRCMSGKVPVSFKQYFKRKVAHTSYGKIKTIL